MGAKTRKTMDDKSKNEETYLKQPEKKVMKKEDQKKGEHGKEWRQRKIMDAKTRETMDGKSKDEKTYLQQPEKKIRKNKENNGTRRSGTKTTETMDEKGVGDIDGERKVMS
uniref:Uncharacterized protein n=1 Tax=Cacopsylla melanoneura TaxID=428564 RepID=A0A8D8ZAS7_9HEMI